MSDAVATIGPGLDGPPNLFSVNFNLGSVGYAVHEYLVSGTAASYTARGSFADDGRWDIDPADRAAYTTRIVVYQPIDPARASGTVVVEWLNVTGGLDIPAVWMPTHRHLVREGITWVGVSAQRVGIEGGGMMPGLGLKQAAPDRYGALTHPGDAFSFDVFTQVVRAVRDRLPVDRVIATGASQSAFHLTTYINAFDQHAQCVDGFLLQGRAGAGAPIEGWTLDRIDPTDGEARRRRLAGKHHIRTDARVPVMVVQSETDVFGSLAYLPARQPDSERFRLWEIAGAAHCDSYFFNAAPLDTGSLSPTELGALIARDDAMPLEVPMNTGPQMHYVLQRAVDALERWMRAGHGPPEAARLASTDDGELVRDELGVGRGGVRSPWVDAPTVVLSGLGQPGDMTQLFGTTRPIDPELLAKRYPGGQAEYEEQFTAAADSAVAAGFVLAVDRDEIVAIGGTRSI
jgi:hypothetical protein